MKKLLYIGIAILLIFPPVSLSNDEKIIKEIFITSEPEIVERDGSLQILMNNASYIREENKPVIPFYTKVYTLPFASQAKVICKVGDIKEINISGEPFKGRGFFHCGASNKAVFSQHENEWKWYAWRMAAGIQNGKRINYLVITFYPVKYEEGKILWAEKYEIEIKYWGGRNLADGYDLLIVCPWEYKFAMKRLAEYKEGRGIKSIVVSLNEIYGGKYFAAEGRDDAEKIKYFIKNAIEEWGIKYVLLVGDIFRLPSRKVYAYEGSENYFLSDLYYADVFNADGSFSSWDTNDNGFYGEYNHSGNKDIIDLYPDVYVGRLPCRNFIEAFFLVHKIINYREIEKGAWYRRFITIAGDSFDDSPWGTDYIEGEITVAESIKHMSGFNPIRIWASNGNLSKENVIRELSKGAGFVEFEGHGNYLSWATHPVHDYDTWIGISVSDMPQIKNYGKPFVAIIGGCHCSQIGMIYECFAYRLLRKPGGAIASIGFTSLSWGADDDVNGNGKPDIIEYASGYIDLLFFKHYSIGERVLGNIWGDAITEYLNTSPVEWNDAFLDIWDAKTVESWLLIGDPSLMLE